jgi:hypothetical protein
MINCINKNNNIDKNFPEDVLFSNCVADIKEKPEDADVLNKFCSQYYAHDTSFGVHKPTHMGNKNEFLKYCPEAIIL